ncbi:pyridoxamine 5'-phosphate oxidase family protein [Streptomyces piniterrae]|uniref:Pyridoxamine 5'-phosphate oxidase family protein n=1 Tax=Streptomyces piniterrae TaxID=2571125 RepID=A0A4U0NFI3_9ACTN|nr:pyridoxamine 5'-phosphate oxidase family protein [Streptomyces piniterrae]TJZ52876.1 pyridoxamine 5'-phosphate oxidase family protein [Streptomyces piniterrae]
MSAEEPVTELHPAYSSEGATATDWAAAVGGLTEAEIFWLSTVRPDGRPHVTPLLAVWADGALHFCTGPDERKAKNLAVNPHCVLTTSTAGGNDLHAGLDVIVEGEAVRVEDEMTLRGLADLYVAKYGSDWRFEVRDGAFHGAGNRAVVFRVEPATAFGFARGETYGQTRWTFGGGA